MVEKFENSTSDPIVEKVLTEKDYVNYALQSFKQIIYDSWERRDSPDGRFTEVDRNNLREITPTIFHGLNQPENVLDILNVLLQLERFNITYSGTNVLEIQNDFYELVAENLDNISSCIKSCQDPEEKMKLASLVTHASASNNTLVAAKSVNWLVVNRAVLIDTLFEDSVAQFYMADIVNVLVNQEESVPTQAFLDELENQLIEKASTDNIGIFSELLTHKGKKIKEYAKDLTTKVITKKTGMPAQTVNYWLENTGGVVQNRRADLYSNIVTLFELEEAHKGSAKELNEMFGIVNFGRYPTRMLLRQYEKRYDNKTPYGVIVMPLSDYSGAFMDTYNETQDLYDKFKTENDERTHEIRIIEGEEIYSLMRKLVSMRNRNGAIEFAILSGHGDDESIQFGRGSSRKKNLYASEIFDYDDETEKYSKTPKPVAVKAVQSLFVEKPTFILQSCNTGRGDNNIAEKLSRLGVYVLAPNRDTHVLGYYLIKSGNKVKIGVNYAGAEAKMYYNGQFIDDKGYTAEDIENID